MAEVGTELLAETEAEVLRGLRSLAQLADAVGRAPDLDALYAVALDALEDALGVSRSSVLLFDDASVMRFRAWRGLSDAYRAAVEGHSPWNMDTQDPAPLLIADADSDASVEPYRSVLHREGIRALAFVPLIFDGRLLGKFMLYYDEPHRFREDEILLAGTIARQIAFAAAQRVSKQRLEGTRAQLEDAALRIASLQRVTAALSEAATTDQVARVITSKSIAAMGALSGAVFRVDAAAGRLALISEAGETALPGSRAAHAGDTPWDEAARTRMAVFIQSRAELAERYPSLAEGTSAPPALGCVPLLSSSGLHGVLVLGFDDSQRFKAEERLFLCALADQGCLALERARLLEAAQEATRSREDLLAIVSHDLRTPLSAISLAAASLARLDERNERTLRSVGVIERNAVRMEHLIRDLLDFSRIDAGELSVDAGPLGALAVMEEAVDIWRPLAGPRELVLARAIEPTLEVFADKESVLRVLGNLIGNAVRHTQETGRIRLTVEPRGEDVLFSVVDDGPGIAPGDHVRLFDRWYRAGSGKARGGGIGLGLFIARGLVEAHGGTISVESDVGRGASFRFSLPRAKARRTT